MTPATIACGFQVGLLKNFGKRRLEFKRLNRSAADAQDYKPAVSRKNPVHPVHRCESKIYSCLTEPFAKFGSGTFTGNGHKKHKKKAQIVTIVLFVVRQHFSPGRTRY